MRQTFALLVLFVLAASSLRAQQARPPMSWTRNNVAWGSAATGAIAADCMSTHYFLAHNPDSHERNIFLGRRPSAGHLNTMCAVAVLGTWGMGHLLQAKDRKWWFGAVTILEAGATLWNVTRR